MNAATVMRRPRVVALPHIHISDAFDIMRKDAIRHLPVVDDKNVLVGMLTERSVCLAAFHDPKHPQAPVLFADATAEELMEPADAVAVPHDEIGDILDIMVNRRLTCLPVIDAQSRLVGLITRTDLLAALRPPQARLREVRL